MFDVFRDKSVILLHFFNFLETKVTFCKFISDYEAFEQPTVCFVIKLVFYKLNRARKCSKYEIYIICTTVINLPCFNCRKDFEY